MSELNEHERLKQLEPYYVAAWEEMAGRYAISPVEMIEAEISASLRDTLRDYPDVAVIAEHKRRSPGEGDICPDSEIAWTAEQYQRGGAVALSVVTQNEHFGGALDDIVEAQQASTLPVLRKDFISSRLQLHETKASGAEAVLLIAAGLSDISLRSLMREAEVIDLECLVEVHEDNELDRALKLDAPLIGVNNRDLFTGEVDLDIGRTLIPRVPEGIVTVAASGYEVSKPDHIRELRDLGADGVLIGTDLMQTADPAAALAAWLATDQFE